MKPLLRLRQLSIGYRSRGGSCPILEGADAELHQGEYVCLIGPNGAGKSTLMRTIAGLQPTLGGELFLDEAPIGAIPPRELARRLSIVTTERVDAGNLDATALVSLGRYPHTNWWGELRAEDHQKVTWALQAVGATELAARPVNELSDGERQKVMIARALAQDPLLMLLDEPTAFLDLPRRVEIMRLLRRLARETGKGILMSTHDLDLALRSADRVWLLAPHGPLRVGAPEDLVLDGSFETVFAAQDVHFDRAHGSFRITLPHAGRIALVDDDAGLAAYWTRWALDRAGYEVVTEAGDWPAVRVQAGGADSWRWTLSRDGAETPAGTTIAELLAHLHRGDG